MKTLLVFLFILAVFSEKKKEKKYHWEEVELKVDVSKTGNMKVTERQTLFFTDKFYFGFRTIPIHNNGRNDGIKGLKVSEIASDSKIIEYSKQGSGKDYYFTEKTGNRDFGIFWYFPMTSGRHIYDFSYQVKRPMRVIKPNLYELFWTLIPKDHAQPIHKSKHEITLPEMADIQKIQVFHNGYEIKPSIERNGNKIKFESDYLYKNDYLEVKIIFKSIFNIRKSGWQDREEFTQAYIDPVLLYSGFLLLFIPVVVLVIFDREPGLKNSDSSDNEIIPPALANIIINRYPSSKDIIATMIDLARRGYLSINEQTMDWEITLLKKDLNIRDYEAFILTKLFGDAEKVFLLPSLKLLSKDSSKIYDMMYLNLLETKYIRIHPRKVAFKYAMIGISTMIIGVVPIIYFNLYSYPVSSGYFLLGSVLSSFMSICISSLYYFSVLTEKGVAEKYKIIDFKRRMEATALGQVPTDETTFDGYLPYMISFDYIMKPEYHAYSRRGWYNGSGQRFSVMFHQSRDQFVTKSSSGSNSSSKSRSGGGGSMGFG